jgi:serine/threonine protein phosphatase 1
MLKSWFRKSAPAAATPGVPDDVRVYAIGDIHGRSDLFDDLIARIADDHAARPDKRQVLILLGDLIDRGPDSAAVVERAATLAAMPGEMHALAGNHEELMLLALDGDIDATKLFCRVGGRETLLSYGIASDDYDRADFADIGDLMRAHIPERHVDFLRGMEDLVEIGDYAFVHAGIRPGVPLADQRVSHLRWIRAEFLDHRGIHPRFIVHGHTITDTVDEHPNRLGIDTGAYATGTLTAVGLDGTDRWFIQTG